MTVTTPPQEGPEPAYTARAQTDQRVVISGVAGLFPQAHHVKDLENILYNKINPITDVDCRWSFAHPEVRHHTGKLPGVDLMDAQFFKVNFRLAQCMDSMSRRLLEQVYQAIVDAGVNPEELSGRKVGVYVGSCFSEAEKTCFYTSTSTKTGLGIAGCSKSMFANRISYWLNAKGPSMSIDVACCSSIAALEQAYRALERGECEAAIVGGSYLILHPQSTVHYGRIVTLSPDGKTRSFDQNADGCGNSEAISVLFLQKACDAKRVYAEVVHVKSQFNGVLEGETGPKFGFYRDPDVLASFLHKFYQEAKLDPSAVEYVEAFGSAVPEADKAELEALERVFCPGRAAPLLVGSVMSNIGYGEAASGISAITKVLLGYHKGQLAANLHCENPRRDVAAIRDGRMRIVTEHLPFGRSYAAVNGVSVTGVDAHVLLNGYYKPKDPNRYNCDIPRLVTISGRQDTAVQKIIDDLKSRPIDPEELALFHSIHKSRISGHLGRGYIILDTDKEGQTISLAEEANYFDDAQRPLWFVYSGMGSQWAGMGTQLMRIPVFAAAIERCQKALKPRGVDVIHIITSTDKAIFNNILNSFVGIAAVQIGLTDVLTSLGIVPDKIIGHSVGELGCAYADGCLTAEEMILSAYSRGLVSIKTPFIKGSMAAVGIGYQEMSELVPSEIEVACHNGPESSTISGPADVMKEFVAKLTAQGIFAKEVPCSNIAYHSRYIAGAGPDLLKYLTDVIKDPKPRSERWVSTSVPQDRWNEPEAKLSSAYYHTNNLLGPVLFEETSRLVPANAVLVEVAPHGLLQAILKRSLPESCKNIPLTRRGHKDNVFMVLDAIGKLYLEGHNPDVQALYPKVEFPVSTGTPMLSHLVEWAHHEKWFVPFYVNANKKKTAACKFVISLFDSEHSYLQGNVIRDKTVYPFAGALVAAWDTLAMSLELPRRQVGVEFHDVRLWTQPALLVRSPLRLSVALHRANGRFEILAEDRLLVTGFIFADIHDSTGVFKAPIESQDKLDVTADDVYQMFYERDCLYRDEFRSILKTNESLTQAQIVWNGNWVTFIDGILQLSALKEKHHTVAQISNIRRLHIDIKEHLTSEVLDVDDKRAVVANVNEVHDFIRCGGVLINNIKHRKLPLLDEVPVVLNSPNFVPRFQTKVDITKALHVYLQIIAENVNKDTINIIEIVNNNKELSEFNIIRKVLNDIAGITVKYANLIKEEILAMKNIFIDTDVVLVRYVSSDEILCQTLYRVLPRNTFLINKEDITQSHVRPSTLYRVVSSHNVSNAKMELIKWRPTQSTPASTIVTLRNKSEMSLLENTRSRLPDNQSLVILAPYPTLPGLKDLVKTWRRESDRNQIYLVMVSDEDNIDVLPDLDLVYNVLNYGVWGGEYSLLCQESKDAEKRPNTSLSMSRIGELDSLRWVETAEPSGHGMPVNVHYTAINDLDAKRAMGLIPFRDENEPSFCMDFSGVTDKGDRVMGILPSGAARGRVRARPELTWPVPAHWSLEDAATVPSAYAHAFYCFDLKVQFQRGYRVLVHGAAGALGQAAISIALAHGCEVFAAVSDVRKKQFLLALFPELQEDHIGNDRDASFGDMVNTVTKGEGCNVIISAVKGELKNVVMNSLANCGIMLDVIQIPNQENFTFGMFYLTKERNYRPIDFSYMLATNEVKDMKRIQVLMSEGIALGYVRPLSRVTYAAQAAPRAFRLLAGSRQRGRVLLRLHHQDIAAEPRITCSPHTCHVVLCDDPYFGLQLADRLVNRGAKKIHLNCANSSNIMRMKILSWQKIGVEVKLSAEDLSTKEGVASLISESNRMGAVESVYVMSINATEQTIDQMNDVVANLDSVTRSLCPSLRYFAIVSVGHTVGQQTTYSRQQHNLPTMTLTIPALRLLDNSKLVDNTAFSWRNALNTVERALRSTYSTLLAYTQPLQQSTLLQQIAKIADLEISQDTNNDATLEDLGIELIKVPAVSIYLQDTHNIALTEDSIPKLTISRIQHLEEVSSETKFKEVHGLEAFFTYVDPDELLATAEMVSLPTLTSNNAMRYDEFDVSQTYLCIVPGMEGHHSRFQVLCERLKLPAVVLQPGLDHLHETPRDTAERYVKVLLKKACLQNYFYLLGYESGVVVALEMAAILEDHGLVGTVFCVGGTPEEFRAVLEEELRGITTDSELQNAVVRHMFTLMTESAEGLDKVLEKCYTWEEKIVACVRMLLGRVAHSAQYARNLIEAACTRVKQAQEYRVQPRKLKSKLVLLHAASLNTDVCPVTSLQKHSQQAVIKHELHETFAHVPQDLRCSAIINTHLDPVILKDFDERNLCETYILNADTFIQFISKSE